MGFFSWKTQDTNKSIANVHSFRATFTVYMIDDNDNVWREDNYDGYGTFGGKDYYELLAEMNGLGGKDPNDIRMKGIELAFKGSPMGYNKHARFPNLVEDPKGWRYTPKSPESCEYQGYFYDDYEFDYCGDCND